MPTPLAKKILDNLSLPVHKREFIDRGDLLHKLSAAQYFECTDIFPLAKETIFSWADSNGRVETPPGSDSPLQFVAAPAEVTWLEWKEPNRRRLGVFIECDTNSLLQGKFIIANNENSLPAAKFVYSTWPPGVGKIETSSKIQEFVLGHGSFTIPTILSLINTPKLTKRIVHSSHRWIARRRQLPGRWPSDDTWNEIKIYIDETVHEDPTVLGPLTGRKGLYHVRTFWRFRLGRWEMVRPHWRGDASLGIVRSRYKPTLRDVERTHHGH